jgi:2-polyprenyl-6-methoxyphenol hydroxylase-like FAD-dependent oxidoreductase
MEFCRRWGIANDVRTEVWKDKRPLDFIYVENMRGRELARQARLTQATSEGDYHTPEPSAHCPQIFFDPLLAKRVRKQPSVSFAYNTSLDGFAQDDAGVTADITGVDGKCRRVRARYLVGCDGATGVVRDALGIKLDGLGVVANSVNIFFNSPDLINLHDKGWGRNYRQIDEAGCWAELIPISSDGLWRLTVFDEPNSATNPDAYLKRMFGGEFPYELINVSEWERRDFVAETYRRRNVFIAGDAAHQNSPTGGLGMATGIEESVNLGWKLAAMIQGWGGPRLLDSYTVERHPVAARNVELSTRTYRAIMAIPPRQHGGDIADYEAALDVWRRDLERYTVPDHVKMQYTYEESPVCFLDGTPAPDPEPRIFAPSSRPGSRAPHVWIEPGKSTLDLLDEGFTLLRLGAAPPQGERLIDAARARGLPMREVEVASPKVAQVFEFPLVLVRPDGHVAWRGRTSPSDSLAVIDHIRGA